MNMFAYRDQATTPQLYNLIRRGRRTVLTECFELYLRDPVGTANLLYKDVPTKYRWKDNTWQSYKRHVSSLGRIVHVSSRNPDRFFLRFLLCHWRSPKSFSDLRTVGGTTYTTFRQAAEALGYLQDDVEWFQCLAEAGVDKMPYQLRQLVGIILVYSLPTKANELWEQFKTHMSEEFERGFTRYDADNRFDRAPEVRQMMAEYKCLKYLAEYLESNGQNLANHDSPDLSTYNDFSEEVEGPQATAIVEQELGAYPQNDLERIVEQEDRLNNSTRAVFGRATRMEEISCSFR
ncbi:hypothetical protein PC129_g745 [Phytophthora cactorum]|uniref:Helitron helicase-like domain-containing protein n=1 Tax=Phytophthora cactorum TaxID=29920 RepID=A0A8T1EWH1_9STRA|nr:hypothetical protein Pcac1_g246 [Phytophthora cactorum]KAG2935045.1 hypothetical protein PC114_g833 [Phytophthora cactorum]KAG2944321.1 hypothetical protein PC115_g432 [Phytophthora cactorum]KAG2955900.1 hypothetical protein PC117_g103 [Phytophthora cactorum]KAG3000338.1 hypothetical protein PC118_g340 [Phytophthora cactorum]